MNAALARRLAEARMRWLVKFNSQLRAKTMKTHLTNGHNLLFKLACKGLRYFLLALLGFAIAYIVSKVFGAVPIANMLLSPGVWLWFARIGVFIFCLFAIAMIFESWD